MDHIIRKSTNWTRIQIVFALLFLVLGPFLWINPLSTWINMSWAPTFIAFILIVILPVFLTILGLGMIILFIKELPYAKKLFIYDETGFVDNSNTWLKKVRIDWDDIEKITFQKIRRRDAYLIHLKDVDKYLKVAGAIHKRDRIQKTMDYFNGTFILIFPGYYQLDKDQWASIFQKYVTTDRMAKTP